MVAKLIFIHILKGVLFFKKITYSQAPTKFFSHLLRHIYNSSHHLSGTDSPDAVHRLMSLSDRVRPHDPNRNKSSTLMCNGVSGIDSCMQSSMVIPVPPRLRVDRANVMNHRTQFKHQLPGKENDLYQSLIKAARVFDPVHISCAHLSPWLFTPANHHHH